MKTVKIILGFLILVGTGSEYANASRQLFTFFSPGILFAVLTMLLLSTWLIASGFSKETLQLKSFQFLKFFLMTFSFFGLVTCISLVSIKTPNDIVEFNNIKVPIGKFMDGSRRIVPDPEERKAYCSCIVEKLANSQKILNDYRTELESGEIDKIFEALKSEDHFAELGIES